MDPISLHINSSFAYTFEQNILDSMQQNRISPGVNYPSVNAPVWTVSMGNVENDGLPTYNHVVSTQFDDAPPNYFDMSIIPNGAVLSYSEIIPYREASKAKVERKDGGVFSMDSLFDKNPDELWLYFMTYLKKKPTLTVHILGRHTEVRDLQKSDSIISVL